MHRQVYARVDEQLQRRLKTALARRLDLNQPAAVHEALVRWLDQQEGRGEHAEPVSNASHALPQFEDLEVPPGRQPLLKKLAKLLASCDDSRAEALETIVDAMLLAQQRKGHE